MTNEENGSGGTIFDDVFRTMVQKLPELLIPVVNEVFGESYPENTEILQLRNEHYEKNGKIITDSIIQMMNHIYHIECQSTASRDMVIRMMEYDFAIALEQARGLERPTQIRFPESCVLYLRHNRRTPEVLEMPILLPDGHEFRYQSKVIKVQNYTKDEMFEKRLLFFLPYYIMRYEGQFAAIERDEERFRSLLMEYEEIRKRLDAELLLQERSTAYQDLCELIQQIADYMLRKRGELKKGVEQIMGGKILTLPSDYIKEGQQRGELYKARRVYQNCISRGMSEEDALAISELREAEEGVARLNVQETEVI